jgi:hypothetical protein
VRGTGFHSVRSSKFWLTKSIAVVPSGPIHWYTRPSRPPTRSQPAAV